LIRPTRVVHVTSAHPATDPRIFEKECSSLAAAGYEVHLVATGERPISGPVKVSIVPRPTNRVLRITLGSLIASSRALATRAQVVHLHDPELALWIPLLRLTGRKVVFDSHEDIAASMAGKEYLPRRARGLLTRACLWLVRFIDHSVTAVVCATPSIAEGFSHPMTRVVQNFPVLAPVDRAPRRDAEPRLVYVGALSLLRGSQHMLDVLQELGRTHPTVRLTIAGNLSEELLDEMAHHPAWSRVDYVGLLDRSGVNELLAESDVGLVMFQPSANHTRSQPTKLFEYMAAGLPVVASDFPLWREMVEAPETGSVADPSDPVATARAVARILDDPDRGREMGMRGRQMIEQRWNWAVEAQTLQDLYGEITQ
jgi:glycosyltransferase involved in cell wall biosynthesis